MLRSECGLNLVVSGAAAKVRKTSYGSETLFAFGGRGFTVLEFFQDQAFVNFYSSNGRLLYRETVFKRKKKVCVS